MQKKIPYPKKGQLVLPDGSKWYYGQMVRGNGSHVFYFILKAENCDRRKANACSKRAPFYGYETIGPRVYSLHRCPEHGFIRVRMMPAEGPEIQKYLKSK